MISLFLSSSKLLCDSKVRRSIVLQKLTLCIYIYKYIIYTHTHTQLFSRELPSSSLCLEEVLLSLSFIYVHGAKSGWSQRCLVGKTRCGGASKKKRKGGDFTPTRLSFQHAYVFPSYLHSCSPATHAYADTWLYTRRKHAWAAAM